MLIIQGYQWTRTIFFLILDQFGSACVLQYCRYFSARPSAAATSSFHKTPPICFEILPTRLISNRSQQRQLIIFVILQYQIQPDCAILTINLCVASSLYPLHWCGSQCPVIVFAGAGGGGRGKCGNLGKQFHHQHCLHHCCYTRLVIDFTASFFFLFFCFFCFLFVSMSHPSYRHGYMNLSQTRPNLTIIDYTKLNQGNLNQTKLNQGNLDQLFVSLSHPVSIQTQKSKYD